MSRPAPHTYGTIVVVQEHRFQLVTESGERVHCELAPSVPAGPADLRRLMDEEAVVRLSLQPSPGTRAQVASRLWRMRGDEDDAQGDGDFPGAPR